MEKSLENRSKNDAKIGPNLIINAESQNVENLLPVEAGSSKTRFRRVLNPSKFDEKSMLKVGSVPDRSWDRFFFDLGWIFAPSWEAKSSKNRYGTVLKKVMKKLITLVSQASARSLPKWPGGVYPAFQEIPPLGSKPWCQIQP